MKRQRQEDVKFQDSMGYSHDPVLNKNKSLAESLYLVTLWKCMLLRSAAFTDGKGRFHCYRKHTIPLILAKAWTGKAALLLPVLLIILNVCAMSARIIQEC